jgi:hypothetical protein
VDALFFAFLAMVVLTTYLLAKASPRPIAAIVPGVFLIFASRTTITEWLLVEFWTLPLLAGSLLAWKRERWWTAAALAAVAVAMRETAAPLILAGLVVALLRRKPWQPWAICGTAALVAFSINDFVASRYTLDRGNDAVLAGTGHPLSTVVDMMTWPFQNEAIVALVLLAAWAIAIWYVARSEQWLPLVGLLTIPLLGFAVDRGYWGLLATPFALWLAANGVLTTIAARQGSASGPAEPDRAGVEPIRPLVATPLPRHAGGSRRAHPPRDTSRGTSHQTACS